MKYPVKGSHGPYQDAEVLLPYHKVGTECCIARFIPESFSYASAYFLFFYFLIFFFFAVHSSQNTPHI